MAKVLKLAAKNDPASCSTCHHFVAHQDDSGNGACRAKSPTIFQTMKGFQTMFPEVPGNWCCGEYRKGSKS